MPIKWGNLNKKIKEYVGSGVIQNEYLQIVLTGKTLPGGKTPLIHEAGDKFIECMLNEINSWGEMMSINAYDALTPWKTGDIKVEDGHFVIEIEYNGNPARRSVAPKVFPEGVTNIVSLLNNGYFARRRIRGWWNTSMIITRNKFDGYHFIERAMDTYMKKYASEYGVLEIKTNLLSSNIDDD